MCSVDYQEEHVGLLGSLMEVDVFKYNFSLTSLKLH